MQNSRRVRLVCITLLALVVCPALGAEDTATPAFKTDKDKVSYLIGRQFSAQIRRQKLNYRLFIKGLTDALANTKSPFTEKEELQIMTTDKTWRLNLTKPEMMTFDANKDYFWVMQTNKGTIKIKLMTDVAPMHATSTIFLTNKGFYNGLIFHRVIGGFMAQGGCPVGDGRNGPGYKYAGELSPTVKHDRPYLLSMANAGPGTDGSQFFITFAATPWLDGKHTLFGEVTEGQVVVKKLEAAAGPAGSGVPPKEKLVIEEATIVEEAK
jgi:peptidyl-prolyl cis-trans isomerase B (cyclophilin B)